MDEVENDALSLLLLLDDHLLPQFFEWTMSHRGHTSLLLYLMESDYLRFKSDAEFQPLGEMSSMISVQHHLMDVFDKLSTHTPHGSGSGSGSVSRELYPLQSSLTVKQRRKYERLFQSRIPLIAAHAPLADRVWHSLLAVGKTVPHSRLWTSMRRTLQDVFHEEFDTTEKDSLTIITDRLTSSEDSAIPFHNKPQRLSMSLTNSSLGPLSFFHVIEDENRTQYFERYLCSEPSNLAALYCYRSVELALKKATLLCPSLTNTPNATPTSVTAQVPASSPSAAHTATTTTKRTKKSNEDVCETLKVLLHASRAIQRQFLPPSASPVSSTTAAATTMASGFAKLSNALFAVRRNSSSVDNHMSLHTVSSSNNNSFNTANSSSATLANHRLHTNSKHILGDIVSEDTRIALQTLLQLHFHLREDEIESVDPVFARGLSHSLLSILTALLDETRTWLLDLFQGFVSESIEYAELIAFELCSRNERVFAYQSKSDFLWDTVRREKWIHWADPRSKGLCFLCFADEDMTDKGMILSTGLSRIQQKTTPVEATIENNIAIHRTDSQEKRDKLAARKRQTERAKALVRLQSSVDCGDAKEVTAVAWTEKLAESRTVVSMRLDMCIPLGTSLSNAESASSAPQVLRLWASSDKLLRERRDCVKVQEDSVDCDLFAVAVNSERQHILQNASQSKSVSLFAKSSMMNSISESEPDSIDEEDSNDNSDSDSSSDYGDVTAVLSGDDQDSLFSVSPLARPKPIAATLPPRDPHLSIGTAASSPLSSVGGSIASTPIHRVQNGTKTTLVQLDCDTVQRHLFEVDCDNVVEGIASATTAAPMSLLSLLLNTVQDSGVDLETLLQDHREQFSCLLTSEALSKLFLVLFGNPLPSQRQGDSINDVKYLYLLRIACESEKIVRQPLVPLAELLRQSIQRVTRSECVAVDSLSRGRSAEDEPDSSRQNPVRRQYRSVTQIVVTMERISESRNDPLPSLSSAMQLIKSIRQCDMSRTGLYSRVPVTLHMHDTFASALQSLLQLRMSSQTSTNKVADADLWCQRSADHEMLYDVFTQSHPTLTQKGLLTSLLINNDASFFVEWLHGESPVLQCCFDDAMAMLPQACSRSHSLKYSLCDLVVRSLGASMALQFASLAIADAPALTICVVSNDKDLLVALALALPRLVYPFRPAASPAFLESGDLQWPKTVAQLKMALSVQSGGATPMTETPRAAGSSTTTTTTSTNATRGMIPLFVFVESKLFAEVKGDLITVNNSHTNTINNSNLNSRSSTAQDVVVFDIDSRVVTSLFGNDDNLSSDLRNPSLFLPSATAHPLTECHRENVLHRFLDRIRKIDKALREELSQFSRSSTVGIEHPLPTADSRWTAAVLLSDLAVEASFQRFFFEALLVPLPQCIQCFPECEVLSCDVQRWLSGLLGAPDRNRRLPFEQFVEQINSISASVSGGTATKSSLSLLSALTSQIIVSMSPPVVDLLVRLGRIVADGRF